MSLDDVTLMLCYSLLKNQEKTVTLWLSADNYQDEVCQLLSEYLTISA